MSNNNQGNGTESSGQGQLLLGLEGLGGIGEARDTQARYQTILQKLLCLEQKILKEYKSEVNTLLYFKMYKKIYSKTVEELKEYSITEKDLESFILAKTNSDYDNDCSSLLGFYSGALLHILTERNASQGKRTRFYINGNGRKFDYLFQSSQVVDEVIVDNFAGKSICYCLAEHGKANRIVGMNLSGDNILQNLGANGRIGQVIGLNINARNSLSYISFEGIVGQVIGINITNLNDLMKTDRAGRALTQTAQRGKANQIIGVDICGTDVLSYNGHEGCINQILAASILGFNLLTYIASYKGHVNQIIGNSVHCFDDYLFHKATVAEGHISQIALNDVSGKNAFVNHDKLTSSSKRKKGVSYGKKADDDSNNDSNKYGMVDEVMLSNSSAQISRHHTPYGKLITGKEAEARFAQISRESHLDEIAALCRAMKTAGYPQILEIADKLYALRPKVPDNFFEREERN